MKTHRVFVGRLYFFASSVGLNTQYATTGSPLREGRIVLNSHTFLEEMGVERECSEKEKL